ncbi:MAG: erythromycin esterase family protein [Planctomycetota bacterium]
MDTAPLAIAVAVALAAAAPAAGEPDLEAVAWLRSHAVALDTTEPGHGFDDLGPLKAMIGDARIVALGEATHGTREFFRMKHRLTEYLAAEMGFTVFSIEANMPEAYRVNEWVLGAEGDPEALIGGMYFWTWNTEEVLDLVRWMRRFNAGGDGRIEFTGFDVQTPHVALEIVRDFVARAEPGGGGTADQVDKVADRVAQVGSHKGAAMGLATASFPPAAAAGKTVRFSGAIRTEGVEGGRAGLWWKAEGPKGTVLASDDMQDRGPQGDTPWQRYEIEMAVPKAATGISFGAMMPGKGTAWFDALKIEIDGIEFMDSALFDLDFEGEAIRGFTMSGTPYFVAPDARHATSGRQSLCIMMLPHPPRPAPPDLGGVEAESRRLLERLEADREHYAKRFDRDEVEWAIQNARVVFQAAQMHAAGSLSGIARDQSMADNVAWILERNPDAKIVLWAHNAHVSRHPGMMGRHLHEWFGDDYVAVAFATAQGQYVAWGDGRLSPHDLQPPPPTSVEASFRATRMPLFLLDLRQAQRRSPGSSWLYGRQLFRSVGAVAKNQQFDRVEVAKVYDLVIWIESTTAAVQLERRPARVGQ